MNQTDIIEGMFFLCCDKTMKFFKVFITDVIPDEVTREEIYEIAQKSASAINRMHYYIKFNKINELIDRLLNLNKYKKEENEENKKSKN